MIEKDNAILHSERYQYLFGLQIIFCREGMELKMDLTGSTENDLQNREQQ